MQDAWLAKEIEAPGASDAELAEPVRIMDEGQGLLGLFNMCADKGKVLENPISLAAVKRT